MPGESGEQSEGTAATGTTGPTNLPWHQIPAFKPGETEINDYVRRLEFLANIWPVEHLAQLAPRACLLCEGSAFQKVVRLDPAKLKVQSLDGIKLVVKTLGGIWGQSKLESKYERFERAIYGTTQRPDETHMSYLARHEIQYEELTSMGATWDEMRAYVLIRNSGLSTEDKKRLVVESKGTLEYDKIVEELQLLGSRFFGELQTGGKTSGNRTKTYDVNYVEEHPDEPDEADEPIYYSQEISEEAGIEALLAEGDEDAMVVQQYEEALIETLQGDHEMATCLNAYLEARRKLTEKVKGRGFWGGKPFKGQSKGKGKHKGGYKNQFPRHRRPLSQRILDSTCKLCWQPGHWKAECPNRDKVLKTPGQTPSTSGPTAFAGIAEVLTADSKTADPGEAPPDDATDFLTEETCFMMISNPYPRPFNRETKFQNSFMKKQKQQLFRKLQSAFRSRPAECIRQPGGNTQESVDCTTHDPLSPKLELQPLEEVVQFVSHGTYGIVDLGASMSVIGQRQFDELCQELPQDVKRSMKESPCSVSFRFGNNSSVVGKKAVYFPVHKHWIKLVIVPSNTPFLIANSVFRSLGAVIDTECDLVFFKRLNRTVPIQLTDRKLYRMDFLDLVLPSEQIAAVVCEGQVKSVSCIAVDQSIPPLTVDRKSHMDVPTVQPSCTDRTASESHAIRTTDSSPRPNDPVADSCNQSLTQHGPTKCLDVADRCSVRSTSGPTSQTVSPGCRQQYCRSREDHVHDSGRTEGREDLVRSHSCGQEVQGNDFRYQVSHMVLQHLLPQQEDRTCEIPAIHPTPCGTDGKPSDHPSQSSLQEQSQSQGIQQPSDRPGLRSGQRRTVGPHPSGEHDGTPPDAESDGRDGECHAGSACSSETHQHSESGVEMRMLDPIMAAELCESWNMNHSHSEPEKCFLGYTGKDDGDHIFYTRENNWVAAEMWEHFRKKGFTPESQHLQKIRADVFEVYCSSNSQITNQARAHGMWAERHGLADGDLSTVEGRVRLYDRLLATLPRDVWMSPKCKAWNKWSVFNCSKSPETAQKIMQAREDDQVHLLLCDALFQFQSRRLDCHAHLEQPVGSQMLYQEELSSVLAQTHASRCDMCHAGLLKNPMTQHLIQKGTQVLTTSEIMCHQLNKLRCTHDHSHDHVAGTIKLPGQSRINLSQYTELYTRRFAQNIIKCINCSRTIHEKAKGIEQTACAVTRKLESSRPEPMQELKRQKLQGKQSPSNYYLVDDAIKKLLPFAPRVGKRWFSSGTVVDALQVIYPDMVIHGVELCKGADRRRPPPPQINKHVAPLRRSMGIHRNASGNFHDENWEEWNTLTRRKLIRNCPPARLLVTVFAQNKDVNSDRGEAEEHLPRHHDEPEPKRARRNESTSDSMLETPAAETTETPSQHTSFDNTQAQPQLNKHLTTTDNNMKHQSHGPRFQRLDPEQKQQLLRMHNNLGHPDKTLLTNVMKDQGWSQEAIEGVSDMHCPTCFERQQPKIARPCHLREPRNFNDVVSIDAVQWTNAQSQNFIFYHMIDSATNFHVAFATDHRATSFQIIQLVTQNWINWAGPPKLLNMDGAGEFCSEEFERFLQSHDIRSNVVPADAHWQLGKCERHGALLQNMLQKFETQHPIRATEDMTIALSHCTAAKNSMSRCRGYSPEILVLGKSRHSPASVSQDIDQPSDFMIPEDAETKQDADIQKFQQNLQKREAARLAFVRMDHDLQLRQSLLKRNRPARPSFSPGQWVMFWRAKSWHGPARVIIQENPNVTWITHVSRLYRCAPEHIRVLSQSEHTQLQERIQTSPEMTNGQFPTRLGTGVFQYHDLITTSQSSENPALPPNNPHTSNDDSNSHNPSNANHSNQDEHPVIQPDSEPDAVSAPEIPSTPVDQPDYPGETNPPEPHDVPVPESDDDALTVQKTEIDTWKIEQNQLIRDHVEPRHHLFNPTMVEDCPIPNEWIESERQTTIITQQQGSWKHHDAWRANIQGHQRLPTAWTGQTVFMIKPEYLSQCPTAEQVANVRSFETTKGYEICLTLDVDDLDHCCRQDYDSQVAYLASSAKKQRSEVKEKDLTPSEKAMFQQAKTKEINSWLSTETVRRIARNQIPEEQILRSRWVLTWKPVDSSPETQMAATTDNMGNQHKESFKPKARLVILGFEDPHLETLARDSPTMGKDSRTLILQYAASAKWCIRSFDIQTAFLRGSRKDGRILGMEPPEEMRLHMKLQPWECCELLKSAYGLVNAPLLWYEELRGAMLSLGFVISPLDPCLFALPKADGKGIHGLVGVHVDDGLGAGDKVFEQAIQRLQQKYPFGSHHEREFVFTGIQISQKRDGSIELSQEKYIEDISPINIDRTRRATPDVPINEQERQGLRGLVGSIQYASTNTRPDLSARLSLLQAKINNGTIKDLLDANRLLHEAKQYKHTKITIKPIPIDDLRFVSFSDASFATRSNSQSQKGCMILAASKCIGTWQTSDVSPLIWYSRKIARVVGSTLASETYALSGSVDLLSWLRIQWSWLCQPSDAWKQPEACLAKCPEAYAVVDCKSLYDLIQKTTIPQCQEYRTMLEALIIKDRIKTGIQIKWVHGAAQLADALTKQMDCSTLRTFLENGRCIIHDVDEILKARADKRSKKAWIDQFANQHHDTTQPTKIT